MGGQAVHTTPKPQHHEQWLATGNSLVCLPLITPKGGSIQELGVISMGNRGILSMSSLAANNAQARRGQLQAPLLGLSIWVDGEGGGDIPLANAEGQLEHAWVPSFALDSGPIHVHWRIFAPPSESGAVIRLRMVNVTHIPKAVRLSLRGRLAKTALSIFSTRRVPCTQTLLWDSWTDSLVMESTGQGNLMALGIGCNEVIDNVWGRAITPGTSESPESEPWVSLREGADLSVPNRVGHSLEYRIDKTVRLQPREFANLSFYLAVNLERDGARTGTVHLKRRGCDNLWDETTSYLNSLGPELTGTGTNAKLGEEVGLDLPQANLIFRRHLLYNHFMAVGRTLDTGEVVPVTSRSPLYYVSGATWERDTLMWSLPALCLSEAQLAREVLLNMFTRHFKMAGEHAHYIDGNVLYPGFELDELALYGVALGMYLDRTQDYSILDEPAVENGIAGLPNRLEMRRHPSMPLYSTMLLTSDDPSPHLWVTYDNVLVWACLKVLSRIAKHKGTTDRAKQLDDQAQDLQRAIYSKLVDPQTGAFLWSADVDGEDKRLYDEPSGSLLLLPFLNFCEPSDPRWLATVRWITSKDNPHCHQNRPFPGLSCLHYPEHPGGLALAASLLSGLPNLITDALKVLKDAPLDGGIVPESYDAQTGEARTGCAFATAAGYLAWALWHTIR